MPWYQCINPWHMAEKARMLSSIAPPTVHTMHCPKWKFFWQKATNSNRFQSYHTQCYQVHTRGWKRHKWPFRILCFKFTLHNPLTLGFEIDRTNIAPTGCKKWHVHIHMHMHTCTHTHLLVVLHASYSSLTTSTARIWQGLPWMRAQTKNVAECPWTCLFHVDWQNLIDCRTIQLLAKLPTVLENSKPSLTSLHQHTCIPPLRA